MFNYLVVTENRQLFHLREESGRLFYRLLQFLHFVQDRCPQIISRRLKATPRPKAFADVDLILVVPRRTHPDLITDVIRGFVHVVLNEPDPDVALSSPRALLRIEIGKRGHRGESRVLDHEGSFQIDSRLLLAVFKVDRINALWKRGTSAGGRTKERKAFFLTTREKAVYRGRTGRMPGRRRQLGDEGNQ